ncbi:MAG: class I SAM-dependent methyltransferase [Campylobacter sp.]|nr:class I SAM-dependent methyltransferase [Campylobacter sp.]
MFKIFSQNAKFPQGFIGKFVLNMMNLGHNKTALWGLEKINLQVKTKALDIGCGGGRNIANLLNLNPNLVVYGIDISQTAVDKSIKTNQKAFQKGRVKIAKQDVLSAKFKEGEFDLVTAFNTTYFWRDIKRNFKEIRKILRDDGRFLILNDGGSKQAIKRYAKVMELENALIPSEYVNLLESVGFKNIEIYNHENERTVCIVSQK